MKKIINNRVYDTETAQLIACAPHKNLKDSTGQTCEQKLYRKKNGEYFIYLKGALSDAAHNINIEAEPHDKEHKIYVLTYDKARKWGEQELSPNLWLELFEPEEDDSKAQIHVNLSKTAIAKIKQAAQKQGITVSSLIENFAGLL